MKRLFVGMCLMSLVIFNNIPVFNLNTALAAAPGSVVINEIAWAGTADSSTDEWIELYNTTASAIDLTGWTIVDDNGDAIYSVALGVVAGNGYFLIEDSEETTSVGADAVINMSLANTGDSLVLKDNLGAAIDSVNSTGGMWFAGNATTKATMERIDPSAGGDIAASWGDNVSGSGATGRLGGVINGTPGVQNSIYSGSTPPPPPGTFNVNLSDLTSNPVEGANFNIAVSAENAADMMSYGFDIIYDPLVIQYVSASEGSFLSQNGTVSTSFNSGLENGIAGKIVVGGARLTVPPSGITGSGELFTLTFKALTGSTQISFGSGSFTSGVSGDQTAVFDTTSVTVNAATVDPVTNLNVAEGSSRYSLTLNWNAPASGADSYKILRKNTAGVFAEIGTSTAATFTDSSAIIPHHTYEYQVIAVKGAIQSSAVLANGIETRGLKGDNNRSDRVDGRDLENLAKHYTAALGSADFDALIDTTYDGIIDGSDLIDIGANWALTY